MSREKGQIQQSVPEYCKSLYVRGVRLAAKTREKAKKRMRERGGKREEQQGGSESIRGVSTSGGGGYHYAALTPDLRRGCFVCLHGTQGQASAPGELFAAGSVRAGRPHASIRYILSQSTDAAASERYCSHPAGRGNRTPPYRCERLSVPRPAWTCDSAGCNKALADTRASENYGHGALLERKWRGLRCVYAGGGIM